MNAESINRKIELEDARLILRWAANELTEIERVSVLGWLSGDGQTKEIGERFGHGRAASWAAKDRALTKMRRRLAMIGIRSMEDLLRAE